jgi:aspartate/glutamate racemase
MAKAKAHDLDGVHRLLDGIPGLLEWHGADVAIVACTDLLYLVAETDADLGIPAIDASDCLARFRLTHFGRRLDASR